MEPSITSVILQEYSQIRNDVKHDWNDSCITTLAHMSIDPLAPERPTKSINHRFNVEKLYGNELQVRNLIPEWTYYVALHSEGDSVGGTFDDTV